HTKSSKWFNFHDLFRAAVQDVPLVLAPRNELFKLAFYFIYREAPDLNNFCAQPLFIFRCGTYHSQVVAEPKDCKRKFRIQTRRIDERMSVTDECGELLQTDHDFVVLHRRNSFAQTCRSFVETSFVDEVVR